MPDNPALPPGSADPTFREVDPQLPGKLPADQRKQVVREVRQTALSFTGPLPPPAMLAEYERVIPGGAERLLRLVEIETSHRHAREEKFAHAQVTLPMRGQFIGAGLCVLFGGIGWHLSINGHDTVAGLLFTTTILGLITVFVLGRVPGRRPMNDPAGSTKRPN